MNRSYGRWIAVIVVVFMAYVTLNTINNVGTGHGPRPGHFLAPFAIPLATGSLVGDANIATKKHQGQRGNRPACQVRDPRQIMNLCQLIEHGWLVLQFAATGDPVCVRELDRMNLMRARFPMVGFGAVAANTDRKQLRRLVRKHHWRFPVGLDRDGAVFSVYGVVTCPTTVFAYPDGVAMYTSARVLSVKRFKRLIHILLARSRKRELRNRP